MSQIKPSSIHLPGSPRRVAGGLVEFATRHETLWSRLTAWMTDLPENAASVFNADLLATNGRKRIRQLHARIGALDDGELSRPRLDLSCSGRGR